MSDTSVIGRRRLRRVVLREEFVALQARFGALIAKVGLLEQQVAELKAKEAKEN